jgi:hypothetical protein
VYGQLYLELLIQQRHAEALKGARLRRLVKQAKGQPQRRLGLGRVGSAFSGLLGVLRR